MAPLLYADIETFGGNWQENDVKMSKMTSKSLYWHHARESSYIPHVRRHFLAPVRFTKIPVGYARNQFLYLCCRWSQSFPFMQMWPSMELFKSRISLVDRPFTLLLGRAVTFNGQQFCPVSAMWTSQSKWYYPCDTCPTDQLPAWMSYYDVEGQDNNSSKIGHLQIISAILMKKLPSESIFSSRN